MLFEREELTKERCTDILLRAFDHVSARELFAEGGSIPLPVLEAHAELERRARFLCESATLHARDKSRTAQLRKIEKNLDRLPEYITRALATRAREDWMDFYKRLLTLHELMLEAGLCNEAEEYEAIIQRLTTLAHCVSNASPIEINAASMFTLLLMQVHLKPKKKKPARKRKSKRSTAKKKTAATAPSPRKRAATPHAESGNQSGSVNPEPRRGSEYWPF